MKVTSSDDPKLFGLRWQSAAATPLLASNEYLPKRRGASLPAAVQILVLAFCALAGLPPAFAATNDLTSALQRGLFEEEANRNLEAAAEAYQAVSKQFDKDRALAATAIFRLGEIYRKQNKTNQAASQYERIVREFPDQDTLVTLSRQNLLGLQGSQKAIPSQSAASVLNGSAKLESMRTELALLKAQLDEARKETNVVRVMHLFSIPPEHLGTFGGFGIQEQLQQLIAYQELRVRSLESAIAQLESQNENNISRSTADAELFAKLKTLSVRELRDVLPGISNDKVLPELIQQLNSAETKLRELGRDISEAHPDYQKNVAVQKLLNEKIDARVNGIMKGMELRVSAGSSASAQTGGESGSEIAVTDDEEKEIRRIQEMIRNSPDLINAPRLEDGTPLFQAAMKGQLQVARFLLEHGAKVNANAGSQTKMWDRWTPLIAAANGGHRAMVELLLNRGADVDAKGPDNAPLHFAAKNGFGGVAEVLLARKANVNLAGKDASTPLHVAAAAGHSAMIELLLSNGANVNAVDKDGRTPLMQASWSSHSEAAKTLLAGKAGVNQQSTSGITALSYAANGNLEVVKALLAAKADPNAGALDLPLAIAAQSRQYEIADLLLQAGATPDLASKTSQVLDAPNQPLGGNRGRGPFGPYTPLQIAVSRNDTAMVKLLFKFKANANVEDPWVTPHRPLVGYALGNAEMLQAFLDAGADANAADRWGRPLLLSACEGSDSRAVELLLAHGAKTETLSQEGRTPLSYAAQKGCVKCVQLLLQAKADANTAPTTGETALHWAAANGSKEMAEALIAHGAQVDRKSQSGETPLHWAVRWGGGQTNDQTMAELLLSKGADPNTRDNAGLTPLDRAKGKSNQSAPTPPGIQSEALPQKAEIAALLRKHGALDDLPDFNSLRVTRASIANPLTVFPKDTNSVNHFTLLEVIRNFYGDSSDARGLPFPDFSKVTIHRPVAGKSDANKEITVNLLTVTNTFDCAKDTWLEFGDVVEIPEREHTLAEQPFGLLANQREELSHCLEGKATFMVRGQEAELKLNGTAYTCRLQLALRRVQNLLRSSSDLSRIRISRINPTTGKTNVIIADSKLSQPDNVWLRDGDVIEVPDK